MKINEKIKEIEEKRKELLEKIQKINEMMPGSFKRVHLKCGKENCWCKNEHNTGHPVDRITWSEQGTSKTKAIPKEDIEWIKKVTKNYREFKNFEKELKRLEQQQKKQLARLEKNLVKATRKQKKYF